MTAKAYIVANEQQEREVLENLGHEELVWIDDEKFPYVIFENSCVYRDKLEYLQDEEIAFDGRKEKQMSDKYVVSQEFMNKLNGWKNNLVKYNEPGRFIDIDDLEGLPVVVNAWWGDEVSDEESNNRLIAIIRWVNGEDVFEVEKPKKWVVRSKEHNNFAEYTYVTTDDIFGLAIKMGIENATKFNTKEEAQEWANSHQEVIEVNE